MAEEITIGKAGWVRGQGLAAGRKWGSQLGKLMLFALVRAKGRADQAWNKEAKVRMVFIFPKYLT